MGKCKDKLYYYFAEKNWGVRREYGPYVDAHREEHAAAPWKHWWLLVRLNWHYRILRRNDALLAHLLPVPANQAKQRLPYLDGAESELSGRRPEIFLAKDLLQYDVVSFDIFDTLILRPFAKPADLFMLVGKRLKRAEFYRIRTDAERRAREESMHRNGHTEVTLHDIYAIIEERTGIPRDVGVQTEFQTELDYCFANPYMQRVFHLLQEQGKPIIIVSDMYLPGELMTRLLEKCGYTGYEKLYVSCDYRCSKRSKSLYRYVKKDYEGRSIIHVGDNTVSDIQSAKASGLATYYYRNCHEIGAPYRADGMSELVGSAYAGIVNTHLHNGTEVYSPYYEYGFTYGGLYVLGFCSWMHRKAKQEGVEKILFLSRDGAIYQRVFNMMYDDIPNEYFLWSRIANLKYTLPFNKDDFLKRAISYRANGVLTVTMSSLLQSLSLSPLCRYLPESGLSETTLIVPEQVKNVERWFLRHWDDIMALYEDESRHVQAYLREKIGDAKRIAVVDVGWLGSGPRGLKYLVTEKYRLPCEVRCWQAAIRSPHKNDVLTEIMDGDIESYLFNAMQNRALFDRHTTTNRSMNNIFFELFTQDVTPSFSGMSCTGEFSYDIVEAENHDIIREIHTGIYDFCLEYARRFRHDGTMLKIAGYDAYLPFRMAIRAPSCFKRYFSRFVYARGISGDVSSQRIETLGDIMEKSGI